MIHRDVIEQHVKEAIAETIPGHVTSDISKFHSLAGDLEFDSLDSVLLQLEIKERFGIEIHDNYMESLTTVDNIIDYVQENISPDPWILEQTA